MGMESESGEVTIPVEESTGEIKIANDVVATIAALAATETKGVAYLSGSLTHDVIAKHSSKNLSKGVRVEVLSGIVNVDVALNIAYGYSIPEVSAKVQERVKSAIENMTGLEVADVNIRVAGVEIPEEA